MTQSMQKLSGYQHHYPLNPVCYFDISIDDEEIGRIVFELFDDIVPKTTKNFISLCCKKRYKNTAFSKTTQKDIIQGGNINGISIYGSTFNDENFIITHDGPGILSMANIGPNTNSVRFTIACNKAEYLNNKFVAFGRVCAGLDHLKILQQQTAEAIKKCMIEDCGVYTNDTLHPRLGTQVHKFKPVCDVHVNKEMDISDDRKLYIASTTPKPTQITGRYNITPHKPKVQSQPLVYQTMPQSRSKDMVSTRTSFMKVENENNFNLSPQVTLKTLGIDASNKKNISNDSITIGKYKSSGSANGRTQYLGPRGGTFTMTSSGNKSYTNKNVIGVYKSSGSANGKKLYKGPRGGTFTYTKSGKKSYKKR
eukprot:538355_1